MPVEFLTDAQAAAYAAYDGAPSRTELERFFFLDDADRELIEGKRRSHNRLGFATQLTTARYLGVFLDDPTDVPAEVGIVEGHYPDRGSGLAYASRKAQLTFRPRHKGTPEADHTETMATNRQEALPEVQSGPRRRVWCKAPGCRIELTDPISRMRGLGPEHDPEPRHESARFDIDQDTLPGL